jgi:anthranilate/para-aminobenzoate synthase component II
LLGCCLHKPKALEESGGRVVRAKAHHGGEATAMQESELNQEKLFCGLLEKEKPAAKTCRKFKEQGPKKFTTITF